MLKINFIGYGRVAKTLSALFEKHQLADISRGTNTNADIYFITTPDDAIQITCEKLVAENALKPNAIVVHCSGCLTSDSLISAKNVPCYIASIHPIKSFADPIIAAKTFKHTFCTFEGDQEALPILTQLIENIGGKLINTSKEHKTQYHAALVMANNYLVTLHYQAVQNLLAVGISEPDAKAISSSLMQDALQNISQTSHQEALTGPIQRGDIQTIEKHLLALDKDITAKNLYISLGLATLPLTQLSPNLLKILTKLLQYTH